MYIIFHPPTRMNVLAFYPLFIKRLAVHENYERPGYEANTPWARDYTAPWHMESGFARQGLRTVCRRGGLIKLRLNLHLSANFFFLGQRKVNRALFRNASLFALQIPLARQLASWQRSELWEHQHAHLQTWCPDFWLAD